MLNYDIETIWNYLIDCEIATEEELTLITNINGHSIDTLNDVIFARTGYRDLEQLKEEDSY